MSKRSISSYPDSNLAEDSLRMVLSTLALGQEEAVGHQGVDPFLILEEEQQDEEKEVPTDLEASSLTADTDELKEQTNQEVREQELCPRQVEVQDKEQEDTGKPSDLAEILLCPISPQPRQKKQEKQEACKTSELAWCGSLKSFILKTYES